MRPIPAGRVSLILIASSFLLASCASAPDPVEPVVADESTFLGLAVAEATELDDPLERASLYGRIAQGYRELGEEPSMQSLALTALELTRTVGATEQSIRTRLELAPLLAAAGNDTEALEALESALAFAAGASDGGVRASLLPLVANSALRSDEAARPILRRAVDEVYVVEQPRRRAEALIRVAEFYQAGDETLSVTGLIQQAIPAVRSVDEPYRRAALFARLAVLAGQTNEKRLAQRLSENTTAQIDAAGAPADEAQADLLLLVVARLAAFGALEDAIGLVELFSRPSDVAFALASLVPHAPSASARAEYLRRAGEQAGRVEDTALSIEAQIVVGFAYLEADNAAAALPYAERALDSLVEAPAVYERIELAGRLAELYVRLDRLQAVRALLLQAPDEFVRGTVAVRAADRLIVDGRLGVADDFLTVALVASDETTYLADGLRQDTAAGFARTGSIRLAIRTIERMDDELLRARAVAEVAVLAEPAGLVTPIYRADLASVLAGRR
ncbi:MAG: hypothetical protein ACOC7V_14725 [Spirochaetota bacterium]